MNFTGLSQIWTGLICIRKISEEKMKKSSVQKNYRNKMKRLETI